MSRKNTFINRFDYRGGTFLLQPYFQTRHRLTENLTINAGLHSQFLTLNNSFSLEPRVGLKWKFAPSQSLSAGYGIHSQMQPTYIYFYHLPVANGYCYAQQRFRLYQKSSSGFIL
jgi:hypothetical protein